jgi:hypothetical protein
VMGDREIGAVGFIIIQHSQTFSWKRINFFSNFFLQNCKIFFCKIFLGKKCKHARVHYSHSFSCKSAKMQTCKSARVQKCNNFLLIVRFILTLNSNMYILCIVV